jgi:hypothetical protein
MSEVHHHELPPEATVAIRGVAGVLAAGAVVLGALGTVHLDRLTFRRRGRPGTPAR